MRGRAPAQRIAVDLTPLAGESGCAVTANLDLLAELAARGRQVLLFVLADDASVVGHLVGPNVERYVVRRDAITPRRHRSADGWPHAWSLSRALGADVLFCPFGDPFWAEDGVPTVCTINELQHLDDRPGCLERVEALADRIVVPSELTKNAVEHQLSATGRVEVIDSSVDALLRVLDDVVGEADKPIPVRPTVAVVMPSYEQGDYIGRSIESVLAQGEVVAEFIVCDGASRDNTVDVLWQHRDELEYVSEPDEGQAAAVNKAIGKSSSDVIAWLNSDDVYFDGALATAATVLAHNQDLDWVYFASDHIGSDDTVIGRYLNEPWDPDGFRDRCFISQPACFFRRDFLQVVGALDESLQYCMDYELWLRMAVVTPPVYVPVVTSGSRLHPATKTVGQRPAVLQEIVDMLARRYGKPPQPWLLIQISDRVDTDREWDLRDPAQSRSRCRLALRVAARTFLAHRTIPDPTARPVLWGWARGSVGRAPHA